jgi:hypothetical protein
MTSTDIVSVEYERSGGQVPTYRPAARVESKDLTVDELQMLLGLLRQVDVYQQSQHFGGAAIPDSFEYRLTVRTNSGERTLTFRDQDGHPKSLDDLVEWIRAHAPRN